MLKTDLQNKPIVVGAPIEIEFAVNELRKLIDGIQWTESVYFIAQRFMTEKEGKKFIYPETYAPEKPGSRNYMRLTPDNDFQSLSFFVVGPGLSKDGFTTYQVGLITMANLELISREKLDEGIFTQELIRDVRNKLISARYTFDFEVEVLKETRETQDVFREFLLNDLEQYNRAPMQCFRIDMEIKIHNDCQVTSSNDNIENCDGELINPTSFQISSGTFLKTISFKGGSQNGKLEVVILGLPTIVIPEGLNSFQAGLNLGTYEIKWRKKCGSNFTTWNTGQFNIVNEGVFQLRIAVKEPFDDNDVKFPVNVAVIQTGLNTEIVNDSNIVANDVSEFMDLWNDMNDSIGQISNPQIMNFPGMKHLVFDLTLNDNVHRPSYAWCYKN